MHEKLLYVIAFIVILHAPASACPSECKCFGFNGEWIADCARKELTGVTFADFDNGTTEIHLQYNFIESLDVSTFENVPNLKHLYLQSNRISELPDGIFDKLTKLETLRLNGNNIGDIGTNKFQFLVALKLLYLHNNDLRAIKDTAFSGLENSVEQISVATNPNLESIEVDTFVNLNEIKMIDMSGSAMKRLDKNLVNRGVLTSSIGKLEKVYTYDIDTLICDDELDKGYLMWMLVNPKTAFGRATMVCGEPENLKGRSVTVVDPDRHYTTTGDCPADCTCFYSGTSYIADCSSRGLTKVPMGFAPETTEIFLQNNNLTRLGAYNFLHLNKLEYLYLHNCFLSFVDLNAFTGANSLKQLTLNDNTIGSVTGVFSNLFALEILNLNNNQLTRIRQGEFSSMPNLVQFSATGNSIRTIMAGAFDSMSSLKYVGLAENNLETLPEDIFANCRNLYFVDVSWNSFKFLPVIPSSVSIFEARNCKILSISPESFRNAINLETLELSNNVIYTIEEGSFANAVRLQTLALDNNNMESVDNNAFASARDLVKLDLNGNGRLSFLSDNAFAQQRDTLEELYLHNCGMSTTNGKAISGLKNPSLYITLEGNPWNCECGLQDFSDIIRTSQAAFDTPTCAEPESEKGVAVTQVDYLSACGDVIETPSPPTTTSKSVEAVASDSDDQTTLIVALTIVLAVLVFAAVMVFILRQSDQSSKVMPGIEHGLDRKDSSTYVNSQYEPDEKTNTEF